MSRDPSRRRDRGVNTVVAVALLVAITATLASVVAFTLTSVGGNLREPPLASVDVVETTFTESQDCPGGEEVALNVTLTGAQRADRIYAIGDGGEEEVVWSDPDVDDVGSTKRVANEVPGNADVDVDIGGGGDIAICPGDDTRIRFFAGYDGQQVVLTTYTAG